MTPPGTERTPAELSGLEAALEHADTEIYLLDAFSLRILHGNGGARRQLGYADAELGRLTASDVWVEVESELLRRRLRSLSDGAESSLPVALTARRRDGSHYRVRGNLQRAHGQEERALLMVLHQDVDARDQHQWRRMEYLLRESERLTRTGSWELELASGRVRWSDELYRLVGQDPAKDRASLDVLMAMIAEDDRAAILAGLEEARRAAPGWRWQGNVALRTATGEHRVVAIHALKSSADGGGLVWGTFQDLTERVTLRQRLARSLELLEQAQALSKVGSWEMVDRSSVTWSRETYRILEIDPGEPASFERFLERVHPDDRHRSLKLWARSDTEEPEPLVSFQQRLLFPDGRVKHVCHRILLAQRPATGVRYFGTMQDVTDRVLAEQALARERDFARSLLDLSPAMVLVLDADGRILYVNPQFERVTGYRARAVTGWSLVERLIAPEDRRELRAVLQPWEDPMTPGNDLGAAGRISGMLTVDGQRRSVEWYHRAIPGADGAIDRVVAVGLDVTERVRSEQVLRDREAELRQAQKLEALGRLTGGVAHDFNNLLGVVVGNLDLLAAEVGLPERARQLLEAATESAVRGGQLTRKLLAFARQQPLAPQRVEPAALLRSFGRVLTSALGAHHELALELAAGAFCRADPAQLEAAVLNLALNARDAMPEGGTVRVTVAPWLAELDGTVHWVAVGVHDAGPGMSAELQQQALEPFFTTKPFGQGSGLGLSMVDGFIRQSGGRLIIDSEEGVGTSVWLLLPSDPDPAAPSATAPP